MEADHIFGSFSRRRQQHGAISKRRSREPRTRLAGKSQSFICPLCECQFREPRVLPCLHTFCTPCLQQLQSSRDEMETAGLGSVRLVTVCGSSVLTCPTCGDKSTLPAGGISSLPPHYVLQHRMVLSSLNQDTTRVLCDLCTSDIPASSRCTECLVSLCPLCREAHRRQRSTASHEVLGLQEARQRGITQVRRQAMCPAHPELELQLFCTTCGQVACRECCLLAHRGHTCDTAPNATQIYSRNMRDCLERARPLADEAVVSLDTLRGLSHKIQKRCNEVQQEVDQFIDSYIMALEEHRRSLLHQVQEAREAKLQVVQVQQTDLERHADDTRSAICFAEDLLAEASDIEMLSLVVPVLHRLEWCCTAVNLLEPRVSDCLQFLPHEDAGKVKNHTMYGVVTTQSISHAHCTLSVDALKDVRQHHKAEAVLVTRDADNQPLCHGGEKITAELRDASRRRVAVQVTDRRDGTYVISFVPDAAGNLTLSVSVQGKPIQGSPFHVCVRTMRPHQGTFHCCSFCSSGGSKEATCGCGGKMPGGYKGCGHGHVGHPGRRHWSCCGNILQNSECGRSSSSTYQFTL